MSTRQYVEIFIGCLLGVVVGFGLGEAMYHILKGVG